MTATSGRNHSFERANGGCCGCSDAEVQRLLCELMDKAITASRQQEIRQRLCECHTCNERLDCEETIRQLVRNCDKQTAAPQSLRERITVSIRYSRTEIQFE